MATDFPTTNQRLGEFFNVPTGSPTDPNLQSARDPGGSFTTAPITSATAPVTSTAAAQTQGAAPSPLDRLSDLWRSSLGLGSADKQQGPTGVTVGPRAAPTSNPLRIFAVLALLAGIGIGGFYVVQRRRAGARLDDADEG